MTPQPQQPNPNELLLITREELDRCCSQMSAVGYKVSANYVEAMVLSRPAPSTETITKELALELCMDARKDAAAQAREDVLDEVIENISNFDNHDMTRGEAIRIIEYLRTGGEQSVY